MSLLLIWTLRRSFLLFFVGAGLDLVLLSLSTLDWWYFNTLAVSVHLLCSHSQVSILIKWQKYCLHIIGSLHLLTYSMDFYEILHYKEIEGLNQFKNIYNTCTAICFSTIYGWDFLLSSTRYVLIPTVTKSEIQKLWRFFSNINYLIQLLDLRANLSISHRWLAGSKSYNEEKVHKCMVIYKNWTKNQQNIYETSAAFYSEIILLHTCSDISHIYKQQQ